jgi:transcriptional regulator with XRE-family HTH domain
VAVGQFALRLKELRAAAGWSQPELAERAGMTKAGICNLEQGRRQASWATVVALADALGVSTEAFREPVISVGGTAGTNKRRKGPGKPTAPKQQEPSYGFGHDKETEAEGRDAVTKLLSDNNWHNRYEVIHALRTKLQPHLPARYGRSPERQPGVPTDTLMYRGATELAKRVISQLRSKGMVEVDSTGEVDLIRLTTSHKSPTAKRGKRK